MTYPLDIRTELMIDGAWTDITTDGLGGTQVYQRSDIVIRWGRANHEAKVSPSHMSMELNNRTGKFSPRNPTSPYYGKIGRNTQIRTRLGAADPRLYLPGDTGDYAAAADHVSLDITGDIDIRLELEPETWRPGPWRILAGKYDSTLSDDRSWLLLLVGTDDPPLDFPAAAPGSIALAWSPDGTLANRVEVVSTEPVPSDAGRIAIQATLDVDNGAGGDTTTWYTAPNISGPWTQLGSTSNTAGTTSVHGGTAAVTVGAVNSSNNGGAFTGTGNYVGLVYAFELRDGIGGSLVASPDFTTMDAGDTTVTDAQGNVWTLNGSAAITDPSIRFAGEVSSWEPRSDTSGRDVWVPVEAAGVRRRLSQGQPNLRSALYRGMTGGNITAPRGYWPCEDGAAATSIASAIAGHPPLRIVGEVDLAAYSDAPASEAIPTFGTGGRLVGRVPGYPASAYLRFMVFANIPDTITGEPTVFQIWTTGTAQTWRVAINSVGGLRVRAFNRNGDTVLDSTVGFDILGERGLMWLYLVQNGPSVEYQIGWMRDGSDVIAFAGGTLTFHTKGNVSSFLIGAGALQGMAVGHVTVLDSDEFWEIAPFARAWAGETAAARVARLCAEEGVHVRIVGAAASTTPVGPQRVDTFLNLVDAAAKVAQGFLVDDRDAVRLLFRDGGSLTNQDVALTIDNAAGQVAGKLQPVEDDQMTRNDITAEQDGGSSSRAVLDTGTMSVLPPPDGVGRYDDTQKFNADHEGQLRDLASWLLHLGTVDEARYPTIGVNLARDVGLSAAAQSVYVGDRLQVTNPPTWQPPDTVDQLAQGGVERLNRYKHDIVYNCTPASPWTVAVAEDDVLGRADTEGSQLAADATAADTTLKVVTTLGPTWTEDPAEVPFDVRLGGEVVTVSAVAPLIADAFTRSVSSGWGAADSGQGWSLAGGAASDYSVNGTRGLVSSGSVGVLRRTILPESVRDVDVMASVATDKVATGNWITAALAARRVDSSNFYMARVHFKHDGNVGLNLYKSVAGAVTTLTAGNVLGTYSAGERFSVRFAVIGTALKAKLWRAGEPEPPWQLEVTDTDLSAAGNVATHNELLSGNTNVLPVVLSWDDLTSKDQAITVTRSVNGVSKAQSAGTLLALAQPAYAAF